MVEMNSTVKYGQNPASEMGIQGVVAFFAMIPLLVALGLQKAQILWYAIQVKLGIEGFLSVETENGTRYHPNIQESDVLGEPDTRDDPIRVYEFTQSDAPGFFSPGNELHPEGLLCYNFGVWNEQGMMDEEHIEDWIALVEIHELAHWACMGQGVHPESGGEGHSPRWNPVIKDEIAYVRGEDSTFHGDDDTITISVDDAMIDQALLNIIEEEDLDIDPDDVDRSSIDSMVEDLNDND